MLGQFCQAQRAYWQQKVDHQIAVTLDDEQHMLRGHSRINYQNNSPDTLRFIYFHLYPNAFRSDRTAYERQAVEHGDTKHYFSDEEDRGFMDSLKFVTSFNGNDFAGAGFVATGDPDIIRLILPQPLLPGSGVDISTDFRVKIPLTFSRLGHEDNAYQISQWFPKPAVYDAHGWHPVPYLDQGEFYGEFGTFTVAITLPADYIVMGTGNIMEASERDWLRQLAARSDDSIGKEPANRSRTGWKTVTFHEENVHDFAWFADKQWIVREDTIPVPGSGHTITAYVCYSPKHKEIWKNSMASLKQAVNGFSNRVGAYPYQSIKIVEAALVSGGGMEYPTIAVIGASQDLKEDALHQVIVHEAGHNWFYGILGSNERKYPWMDEGINSFYEKQMAPETVVVKPIGAKGLNFFAYAMLSSVNRLLPADTAAELYPAINYAVDVYEKNAYYLQWLQAYMGADQFEAAMKDYYEQWKFKHPQPQDFINVFRSHSGKKLDWFFDSLMPTTQGVDYAIKSVKRAKGWDVTVVNKSRVFAPVQVCLYQDNGDSLCHWSPPFLEKTTLHFEQEGDYKKIGISPVIPDALARNNFDKTGFKLRPFIGFNMDPATKVWLAPALGFNYYNGFMLGGLLHNFTLPQNRFQFALAPLYAFGSGSFAGGGLASYTSYCHSGWLKEIEWKVGAKTFSAIKSNLNIPEYIYGRYIKVAPEVVFHLRKPHWRSTVERSLSLKGYWIREDYLDFNQDPVDSLYRPALGGYHDNFYGKLRYMHRNERTFNPFSYTFEGQIGAGFAKVSAEANIRIDYHMKNKGLYLRAYAGKFFAFSANTRELDRYRLTTTYSGANDYLYDETYLGRNMRTGFYAQQMSMKEGGFKINTLQYGAQLGYSDNWLLALNLKTDLPLWNLPLRLFADVATCANMKQNSPSGAVLLYEAGIEIYISNYLSVYLPLVMSKDYADYTKSIYPENRFLRTIAFSLNLGDMNWSKLTSSLLKM